jgi:hypothetical protein
VSSQPPAPAWHESLITKEPDGTEKLADFATWRDKAPKPLADFITGNMTAARAKTEGMLKLPTAETTPEEWDGIYKALGRPDAPEGYEFKAPEEMPEGVTWDEAATKRFAPIAHKIGLTPAQVAALSEYQIGEVAAQTQAFRANVAKEVEAEQKKLGEYFPGENGLTDAAVIAQKLAGDCGIPAASFDPSSPDFWGADAMKMMVALARRLAKREDEGSTGAPNAANPVQGGFEWAYKVSSDKNHPDYDAYHGGKDAKLTQRVNEGWALMPKGWKPPQ